MKLRRWKRRNGIRMGVSDNVLKKIREREGVNVCAQMPDIRKKEKGMKTFNHILELFDPDIS